MLWVSHAGGAQSDKLSSFARGDDGSSVLVMSFSGNIIFDLGRPTEFRLASETPAYAVSTYGSPGVFKWGIPIELEGVNAIRTPERREVTLSVGYGNSGYLIAYGSNGRPVWGGLGPTVPVKDTAHRIDSGGVTSIVASGPSRFLVAGSYAGRVGYIGGDPDSDALISSGRSDVLSG